jgi:hypothetical protein
VVVEAKEFGWDIGVVSLPHPRSASWNHSSTVHWIDDVRYYVQTDLVFGTLLSPVSAFPSHCVSVWSSAKADHHWFIMDCTFRGFGINAFIPKHWYCGQPWKISLPTIDEIITNVMAIREQFPGVVVMAFKMDLARYFHFIGVDPGQVPFLGGQ